MNHRLQDECNRTEPNGEECEHKYDFGAAQGRHLETLSSAHFVARVRLSWRMVAFVTAIVRGISSTSRSASWSVRRSSLTEE